MPTGHIPPLVHPCPVAMKPLISSINQRSICPFTFSLKFDCCFSLAVKSKKLKMNFTDSITVFVVLFYQYTTTSYNRNINIYKMFFPSHCQIQLLKKQLSKIFNFDQFTVEENLWPSDLQIWTHNFGSIKA